MNKEQLLYFVYIVDTGSYTATALDLNITQSSISKQIQSLERELNIKLFDRSKRNVNLTPEGQKLLPLARKALEDLEQISQMSEKLRRGYEKRINVITLPFLGYLGLHVPLRRFELDNPTYHVSIREVEEPLLFRLIQENKIDIALTYWDEDKMMGYENNFHPIIDDEIVFAVNKKHPFAKLESITVEQIQSVPIMLMEPYASITNNCMIFFAKHEIKPDIIFRGRPDTIYAGVDANRGAALLSRRHSEYLQTKNVVIKSIVPKLIIAQGAYVNPRHKNNEEINRLLNTLKNEHE